MTFWQENYSFIKDVYDMRHQKMAEWMENVEKAIARIMADKVYTSAEFKRERDNFHALCKDLERAEVKKWLAHILEILMAERAKDQRNDEMGKLDAIIKKHEELIPTVMKTQVMVDLYWKCYAYGDELKPHIEFLDGIMLSSTRDIAPSCVENVDELIERQEKSLLQLETKRGVVKELIEKGKIILMNPDKPKFLEGHVQRIEVGWDDTKQKAQDRLKLLTETKDAWVGYAENNETIASDFDKAEDEIKRIKKRFNLAAAMDDLKKRQDIYNNTNKGINGLFTTINDNLTCMSITLPDDKKKILEKEIKAVSEKLEVVGRLEEKVKKVEEFCNQLNSFDVSLKAINNWMASATAELEDIKAAAGTMLPEDRVARTMDLQEDIASKVEILKTNASTELDLLPQGENVPKDAQDYKDELNRITKYVTDLQTRTKKECDSFSEDVKYWAEYRTGLKEFTPWLVKSEASCNDGLAKPSNLDEVKALHEKVTTFDKTCINYLKVLEAAESAAKKMTTHVEADAEVAALKARYSKVKTSSDVFVAKVDTLFKEWTLLDNTVTELNTWVAKDKSAEGENQFSLEKMESTLGELKNIFKQKEALVEGL
jgi:soluble cytochrome b562